MAQANSSDFHDHVEVDLEDDDEVQIDEYDLTSSPNDFNVVTIGNFIDSGAVKIPGFQRNYVWDIKRASRLIESLIMGLPVPQVFLYEESRNSFLVIDGQQRLMSIYYFIKQRFPRKEKRSELRQIFASEGKIPESVLHDDKYFEKFILKLSDIAASKPNKFSGRSYATLEEYRTQFDLRTIRNVIVKQNVPKDDDSSIYAIFNRLNTGGMNLTAQEIRASLYHSDFYDMLSRINSNTQWRRFLNMNEPDLHMRDIEILLRAYALLILGDAYTASMTRFLNTFSRIAKKFSQDKVEYYENIFNTFIEQSSAFPANIFSGKSGKFSTAVFESIFSAIGRTANESGKELTKVEVVEVVELKKDPTFQLHSTEATTNKANVYGRLKRAIELLTDRS